MIEAVGNRVVVCELEHGERKFGNIIVQDDDGKRHGIRSRWCKVFKIGGDVRDIEEGQWILVEHGRWSLKFKERDDNGEEIDLWIVDYPKHVLAVADEKPDTWNFGNE